MTMGSGGRDERCQTVSVDYPGRVFPESSPAQIRIGAEKEKDIADDPRRKQDPSTLDPFSVGKIKANCLALSPKTNNPCVERNCVFSSRQLTMDVFHRTEFDAWFLGCAPD